MDETIRQVATIKFTDLETNEEALFFVRRTGKQICLGATLKFNGDYEVVMDPDTCNELIAALQKAVLPQT